MAKKVNDPRLKDAPTRKRTLKANGKYRSEVISTVQDCQDKGLTQSETGVELAVKGFTSAKSESALQAHVRNVLRSPEYQTATLSQLKKIDKALEEDEKYEDASLRELVYAKNTITKTALELEGEGNQQPIINIVNIPPPPTPA